MPRGIGQAIAEIIAPACGEITDTQELFDGGEIGWAKHLGRVQTIYFSERDGIGIARDDFDVVAGGYFPFASDGEINARTARDEEALDHFVGAEADAEFVAREARLGDDKFR